MTVLVVMSLPFTQTIRSDWNRERPATMCVESFPSYDRVPNSIRHGAFLIIDVSADPPEVYKNKWNNAPNHKTKMEAPEPGDIWFLFETSMKLRFLFMTQDIVGVKHFVFDHVVDEDDPPERDKWPRFTMTKDEFYGAKREKLVITTTGEE